METADPRDALVDELVQLRSVVNAAEARSAEIVAELSALDQGHPLGCRSPEQFLSWTAGLSHAPAKALAEVGSRLGELPSLRAAAKDGSLSISQARAIASVARDDADAADFVKLAKNTTCNQLEAACRHARRVRRADEDADTAARRRRRLRTWWSVAGTLRLDGELDAEAGAIVATAIEQAQDLVPSEAAARADSPPAARAADALAVLARAFLGEASGPEAEGSEPVGQLSVHVGLDARVGSGGGDPALADLCRLGWNGVGVSDAMARRLGCDSALQAVIRDGDGNPLALGRARRVVNRRLRRALHARDAYCQAPGCGATQFLAAHHVVHWADGGPTDLDNLVLLCHWHHAMLHDGRFVARVVDGEPVVKYAESERAPRPPPPVDDDLATAASAAGIAPDPHAARSQYDGGSMDYACFDAAFNQPPAG